MRGEGGPGPAVRRRTGSLAVALLAWLVVAPSAQAQEREGRRPPARTPPPAQERAFQEPAERLVDRFAERAGQALGLDRRETERLRAVLQDSRRERVSLRARLREVRMELAELVRSGAADPSRVDHLLDDLLRLRVRMAEVEMDENRRLAEFLSPLERARLFHLKQRLAQRALELRRRDGERPPP